MYGSLRKARGTPMPRSEFERALGAAEHRAGRAAVELARTRRLLEREDMAGAFGAAFAFSAEVEKLALLARVLPAYTGHPKAAELKEQMLMDTIPVEMGYAKRGWFRLQIPALLPKKESGSPIYIQQYLYRRCGAILLESRRLSIKIACWPTAMCTVGNVRSVPIGTTITLRSTW